MYFYKLLIGEMKFNTKNALLGGGTCDFNLVCTKLREATNVYHTHTNVYTLMHTHIKLKLIC